MITKSNLLSATSFLVSIFIAVPVFSQPQAVEIEVAKKEVKMVTFLGIETSRISKALRNQVDIPDGVGLIIDHVAEDTGAAEAGLLEYDILLKVDDQIIINQEQLSTLIRSKEPNDRVAVAVLRKGKNLKFKVKLGQREESKFHPFGHGRNFTIPVPPIPPVPDNHDWTFNFNMEDFQERMKEFQEKAEEMGNKAMQFIPEIIIEREGEDGSKRVTTLGRGPKTALITQGNLLAKMEILDGKKQFHISRTDDGSEEVLYEGGEPTEKELSGLPEEVQALMKQLSQQNSFNWKGMDDLKNDKIRVIINTGKEEAQAPQPEPVQEEV